MKKLIFVVFALLALGSFAAAATKSTTVYFNVPSSISFSVTLPGQSATTGATTANIEFNSSIPTINKINCSVMLSGGVEQTDLIPCFNYSNTGNQAINITLKFDSLPAGVTVKAGLNDTAWIASCACAELPTCNIDDCIDVADSDVTVSSIAYAGYEEVWLWADFSSVMGGTAETRTLTHTSVTP